MTNTTKKLLLATCFFVCVDAVRGDDDWTMFRGPNGAGISSTALPEDLSLANSLIWKASVPKGYSSPVFWGGKIFLTAEEDGQLLTICIDQASGKQVWRVKSPRDRKEKLDHRNHPSAASPAVDLDSVVVFFGDFGLVCYSHSGIEKWRKTLGPFSNIYGMGSSPIIVDGNVILVCDQNDRSFAMCIDKKTGKTVWKTERPAATSGHCTPVVYRPDNDGATQVLVAGSFYLTAYSVASGKKIWWVGGLSFEMKSTPVISDGLVFANGYGSPFNQPDKKVTLDSFAHVVQNQDSNKNGVLEESEMPDAMAKAFFAALDLDGNKSLNQREWKYFEASMATDNSIMAMKLGGSGDVTKTNVRWKYHKNVAQLPSPVAVDGRLYMINDRGIVTNFVASTGDVSSRGRLTGASGNVYASPVVAGNQILFLTTGGKMAILPIGDDLEVVNLIDFNEPCFATPAVVNGRLFVRTNHSLFCLGN